MEVRLAQHEIERAIRLYLTSEEGIKLQGRKLEIEFNAGRNPPTVSADIKITKARDSDDADATVIKEEEESEEVEDKTPFSDTQTDLPFLSGE